MKKNKIRRRSILARWDKEVLLKSRNALKDKTDAEISRILYRTSPVSVENFLVEVNDRFENRKNKKKKVVTR